MGQFYANMLWLDSNYPIDSTKPGADRGSCPTSSGKFEDVVRDHPNASVAFCKTPFQKPPVLIANKRLQPTSSSVPSVPPSSPALIPRSLRAPLAVPFPPPPPPPGSSLALLQSPTLAPLLSPSGASAVVTSTPALPPALLDLAAAARASGTLSAFLAKWSHG